MHSALAPTHLQLMLLLTCASVVGSSAGCASSSGVPDALPADAEAPVTSADAAPPLKEDDGGGPVGGVASNCPSGQFATGIDSQGLLICAALDGAASAAVNEQCTVFLGWRDSCDGCTEPPSKWGQVSGLACANGAGTDNTCTTATLGTSVVELFGLNTDGDIDGNDKFYVGLRCQESADGPISASSQCEPNSFMSAVRATEIECVSARDAVSAYAQSSCQIYFGWRDSCDGCTTAPAKVGRVGSAGCTSELGADNTCINSTIAGGLLDLFGLNTDGDVNDDDKFDVGFQCAGASADFEAADAACSPGYLVTAILADGSLECTNPGLAAQAAVQSACHLYYGWRDNCDGCTTGPSKWGRVSHNVCENGVGANNTCTDHDVGGAAVKMFGLNTDGDVNGDDTFYAGLHCDE